jgi:hypothetical protein
MTIMSKMYGTGRARYLRFSAAGALNLICGARFGKKCSNLAPALEFSAARFVPFDPLESPVDQLDSYVLMPCL